MAHRNIFYLITGNSKDPPAGCKSNIDITRQLTEIGKNYLNMQVNSLHSVDVTHVVDPGDFYVRPTAYRDLMDILEAPGSGLKVPDIHVQTPVVFMSGVEKKHLRGNICHLNIAASTVQINAVDYGFTETVAISEVFTPSQDYGVPPLAISCQLIDCDPRYGKWDSEAIDAMKDYIYSGDAKIVIRGNTNGKYLVEVFTDCDNVALLLVQIDLATFGCAGRMVHQRRNVPKAANQFFTFKTYKQDDILVVRTLSGKTLEHFYVAELDTYQEYLSERANVTHFSKQSQNLTEEELKAGIPVCVFDISYNRYDRCIVKETSERQKAVVQNVDTGSVRVAHLMSMKRVSQKLFRCPATAIYCSANEDQRYDNRFTKLLHPGQEVKMKITDIGDLYKPYVVQILEIGKSKM